MKVIFERTTLKIIQNLQQILSYLLSMSNKLYKLTTSLKRNENIENRRLREITKKFNFYN